MDAKQPSVGCRASSTRRRQRPSKRRRAGKRQAEIAAAVFTCTNQEAAHEKPASNSSADIQQQGINVSY